MCMDTEREVNISIITAWHSFKHKKKHVAYHGPLHNQYLSFLENSYEKLQKAEDTFNITYLFQHIQLQVQLAEHHISSPEGQLQVRWPQILNILVYIAHQEWCDIGLQHLVPVLKRKTNTVFEHHSIYVSLHYQIQMLFIKTLLFPKQRPKHREFHAIEHR